MARRLRRHAFLSGADLPTPSLSISLGTAIHSSGWVTRLRPFLAPARWYGTINPLSITYAYQPRLRPD
jgi:hypothetical protein